LRAAAVILTRTWCGPGVGIGLEMRVRSLVDVALRGMVQAEFVLALVILIEKSD
jgi:hypothetical protein